MRKKYGKNSSPYFSPASLRRARRLLAESGLSHREFADRIGVSINTIRDLLYGRVAGMRGNAHRAAVSLGLKRNPDKTPLPPLTAKRPQPVKLRKPNAHELRIIDILRRCRQTAKRFSLLDRHGLNILPISAAELARIHGFDANKVEIAFALYLGRTDRIPIRGSESWLIMFAASCQAGGEVCKGMAAQIQAHLARWESHIE